MNALQVYALLNKKVKGLTSGIQSASVNGTTITFTMNDGSTQTMTFPTVSDGKSLEYNWDGTKLGVRVEGNADFEYVDLKGDDGTSPTITLSRTDENDGAIIEVTNADGTINSTTVYDGKGGTNLIVVDEKLICTDSSEASVNGEILKL